MKKLFGIFLAVWVVIALTASSCWAMTLSQPVKVGEVSLSPDIFPPIRGFKIKGASYNKGTKYSENIGNKKYDGYFSKGLAIFGSDDAALYVHYDYSQILDEQLKFGGKDINNTHTIVGGIDNSCVIYKISSDEDIMFYVLNYYWGAISSTHNYIIIGRLPTGQFVKYLDVKDIGKNYIAQNGLGGPWYGSISCSGDTIIIEYENHDRKTGEKIECGELRFKWDNDAQWFGVEQVAY